MNSGIIATLITLGGAIAAFFLGPIIFPLAPGLPTPTETQATLFLLLAIVEAASFGLGLAFIALGYPLVRKAARISRTPAWPAYLSISWLLASWWPHISLHGSLGFDLAGLLIVDYLFHVPYVVTAAITAHFFWATLRRVSQLSARAAERTSRGARIVRDVPKVA